MKLTIIAVLDVPDVVASRSDDALLDDASTLLASWPTHEDAGRYIAERRFVSVRRGVSDAALAAGADPSGWPE